MPASAGGDGEYPSRDLVDMTATPYMSLAAVRSLSGISTSEFSDDEFSGLLSLAVGLFNAEVNIEVGTGLQEYEEMVADETSTTVWWTKKFPIVDSDGDGVISSADISCYDAPKQENPNSIDVSAISDAKTGKVTLAAANDGPVYASYSYSVLPIDSITFISCFGYFAAYMAWDRLMATVESQSMGNMSISRRNYFKDRYDQMRSKMLGAVMFKMSDSNIRIPPDSDFFDDPDAEEG